MLIGNDIVDLQLAAPHHPRFALRVLSPGELERMAASTDPELFLWRAWAAKEAAYKALRRLDPQLEFHPKELVFTPKEDTIVAFGARIPVFFQMHEDYVFCRAHLGAGEAEDQVTEIAPRGIGEDPAGSEAVRELARQALASGLAVAAEDLRFRPGPGGEPRAFLGNRALEVPLSFTHDGRYAAVTAVYG